MEYEEGASEVGEIGSTEKRPEYLKIEAEIADLAEEDAETMLGEMHELHANPIPPGTKADTKLVNLKAAEALKIFKDQLENSELLEAFELYQKKFQERFELGYPFNVH